MASLSSRLSQQGRWHDGCLKKIENNIVSHIDAEAALNHAAVDRKPPGTKYLQDSLDRPCSQNLHFCGWPVIRICLHVA